MVRVGTRGIGTYLYIFTNGRMCLDIMRSISADTLIAGCTDLKKEVTKEEEDIFEEIILKEDILEEIILK